MKNRNDTVTYCTIISITMLFITLGCMFLNYARAYYSVEYYDECIENVIKCVICYSGGLFGVLELIIGLIMRKKKSENIKEI